MTRKKKCNSESNSFVAAAGQVCLQRVLEHRQRRGSAPATGKARPPIVDRRQVGTSSYSVEADLSLHRGGAT